MNENLYEKQIALPLKLSRKYYDFLKKKGNYRKVIEEALDEKYFSLENTDEDIDVLCQNADRPLKGEDDA